MSLPFWTHPCPPATANSIPPLLVLTEHGVELVIYDFPLAIYFTHGNVYVSTPLPQFVPPSPPPTVSSSLFSMWSTCESCSVVSHSLQPHGIYSPWNFPGQNTGVGSHSLLQGIFSTQGSNLGFPHCRQILYQLNYHRSLCLVYVCNSIPALQIKAAMRYHLTLVRMAIIKKSANNKCCRGCGEKGIILHCWWGWKLRQPLWRTVWRLLKKKKQKKN